MIIRIELRDDQEETEIILRCREAGDDVRRLHRILLEEASAPPTMAFSKDGEEFYIPLADVFFFETDGDNVYAHTAADAFRVGRRLYELEALLPSSFLRVSKSAILNITHIYSIQRNLTASSPVQFHGSHKKVYVSRLYYKELRRRLDDRCRLAER